MSRRALIITGSVGALLLVLAATGLVVASSRADQIIAGVRVEGVDVGGLEAADARDALQALVASRSAQGVSFVHAGVTFEIDPVEAGVAVDIDGLVDDALDAGRTGAFFSDRRSALFGSDIELELVIALDEDAITARIAEIAGVVDIELFPGGVTVDAVTLQITPEAPIPGVRVLQLEAVAMTSSALTNGSVEPMVLPVDITEPDTDDADVAALAAQAASTVANDLHLTTVNGDVVLSPREVAALLSSEAVGVGDAATLRLVITPDAVRTQLQEALEPLTRAPVNASYDAPAIPATTFDLKQDATWRPVPATVSVIEGRDGSSIDPTITAEQLTNAVELGLRKIVLLLRELPPAFTTAQARESLPDTLLSTFTTYHACCAARVHNIQRLSDMVDRTVVLPGDQLSINQISGIRKCSKGFKAAGMILKGEIVDSCGGGVSQFGTTTINAVFFAGLTPDAYKPHSFFISRYPAAREATLNYPSPDIDVQFTNDTGTALLIRASHTATSITVTFYGSSDVTEVRADVGSRRNIKPFKTVRRVNSDLAGGAENRIQGGQDGFYISLTRTIVRGSDSTEDDWSNTYVPETEIYEYNPAKPKPKPTEPAQTEPAASEPAASEPATPTEPADA
ncbi:MAG: vancomycin resistance protein YoaR [Nitriliruptoraceae bacterium]|jgi:vancomycin resistance protein YoaR